tara:strand:- start:3294 stop:4949 length:1656 start_codon:yes stop_codon:yes gene_type:complete
MTNVPSNLIPTRISQLPTAPVASADGMLLFNYEGVSYQVRAGDLLQVAGVPITRQVIAGTALTGGGPLSSDVTLSVAVGGIGTTQLANSGATPGTYGNTTDIPVVTIDATGRVTAISTVTASFSNYVPITRQIIAGNGLEGGGGLNANVTLSADFEDNVPLVTTTGGAAGTSNELSRGDHQHPPVDLSNADQIDGVLPIDQGGTGQSITSTPGGIVYGGSGDLSIGPAGASGQVLVSGGTGAYTWGSALIQTDQPANVFYGGPTSGPAAPTAFRTLVDADLPTSGVTPGSYGSSNAIPVIVVNDKGVITGVSTASFQTGLDYQGTWNASTNTPTLTSSTGTAGYYYIVNVAGTTNLDGITDWEIGDWAVFSSTGVWQKIDQSNTVTSVNGQVGAVTLTASDVGAPATNGTGATGTWGIDISGTAASATNVASGGANQIVYNTASGTSDFLTAPTVTDTFLKWDGSAFVWTSAVTSAVSAFSGGTTGFTPSTLSTGDITLAGTLVAANGGTGLTSPGTSGNVLTSNGTNWVSQAPSAGVTTDDVIALAIALG